MASDPRICSDGAPTAGTTARLGDDAGQIPMQIAEAPRSGRHNGTASMTLHVSPAPHPARQMPFLGPSICVFCGSGAGDEPRFVDAAQALGVALAREGIGLVFGGGSFGLMGVIARASIEAGGYAVGVIPQFLRDREKPPQDLHELVVTTTMHERKQIMFDRSSAFVALPGGLGTLDEIVEQMIWVQIGHHNKPILFLNVARYWDPMLAMIDRMRARQFIRPGLEVAVDIADAAADVIPAIKQRWREQSFDLGFDDVARAH